MAATAAEARFRLATRIADRRATRVVALDAGADVVVRRVATQPWDGARFFSYESRAGLVDGDDGLPDIVLRTVEGSEVRLSEELAGADVMVMIATADDGAPAASAIGDACTVRGIMTAGLILGEGRDVAAAVSALRPHARVLMATRDEHDVSEMLTALRA